MRLTLMLSALILGYSLFSQSYSYYPIGDTADVQSITLAGTCLMGGASEDDNAMTWFLERSGGGNVLVIRASGSDGYNDYLYSDLGVEVQSVETIVFNNASAAEEPFVLGRIAAADAIWIAGGDQWDYVSYWRDSPVGQLLQEHISIKQAPIGGTSAGMAILGGAYFSAQNGTITSATALNNPYASSLTLGFEDFIHTPYLQHTITDTHYDDPDRKGRHMVFLARIASDQGVLARGIACDEYTAVCIDENGLARVFGEYPTYDDNAYFLQANCEGPIEPELCEPNSPLTWNRTAAAVKVYHIQGDWAGSKSLDLNDWQSGTGGQWEHWWVSEGMLSEAAGSEPDCSTGLDEQMNAEAYFRYAPAEGIIQLLQPVSMASLTNILGQRLSVTQSSHIQVGELPSGVYLMKLITLDGQRRTARLYLP